MGPFSSTAGTVVFGSAIEFSFFLVLVVIVMILTIGPKWNCPASGKYH